MDLDALPKYTRLAHEYTEGGMWRLTRALFYYGAAKTIIVPKGFVTDLDSVPRLPGIYAAFKGRAVRSAVVHDWLYESQAGKSFADSTFLQAMKDEGIPARWRYPIYWAVALFGGSIYSRKRA